MERWTGLCVLLAGLLAVQGMAGAWACVSDPVVLPSEVNLAYQLGDTWMNITTYTQPNAEGQTGLYSFINLHQNENTSVVAAKTLIYQKGGGSIVFLQHGGTRDVEFTYNGVAYSIDPNRMFTWPGLEANLIPYDEEAAALVAEFARTVLEVYDFDGQSIVLALHNNSPGYSALDYLPGEVYAEDASAVHIGDLFNPRDFFFVSNGAAGQSLYNCLTGQDFNAVLQVPYHAPNSTLTDDGSLSVYAALNFKPYVNTEAAAACCSEGTAVVNQLILLDHLTTQVAAMYGESGNTHRPMVHADVVAE